MVLLTPDSSAAFLDPSSLSPGAAAGGLMGYLFGNRG